MANINITLGLTDSCPAFEITDGTDYTEMPLGHQKADMGYARVDLHKEAGKKSIVYSSVSEEADNFIASPSNWIKEYLSEADGVLKIEYTQVPSPVNGATYEVGDCLYVLSTNSFILIDTPFTWNGIDEISTYGSAVTFDNIPTKYKDTAYHSVRCHAFSCIREKLSKAVCAIEKWEGNNSALCKDYRFRTAVNAFNAFYTAYYGVTVITSDNYKDMKRVFSYLNSFCCK